VVFRRGQIRIVGWVIKTLEAQVGHFLLGWKCPVNRFLPGRANDLSAPRNEIRSRKGSKFLINVNEIMSLRVP
jgi:hypothetical protein